jgi:hypothetical protein
MFDFTDTPSDQPYVFNDGTVKPIPPQPIAENRALMANYGLGTDSPGAPAIQQTILDGGEDTFRQTTAAAEDSKYEADKTNLITTVAQNAGGDITPDHAALITGLAQTKIQHAPDTILEKKFADKYVSDTLSMSPADTSSPQTADDANAASHAVMSKTYFQTRLEDLQSDWEQQGIISKAADLGAQLIPFLPWWRQAQALADRPTHMNFLQGQTMRDNVMYLYSLPMAERKAQYDKAIDYLKSQNLQDALTFAQAMVAFPTSDEYLANAVSMADYGTAASVVGKIAGRFIKPAVTAAEKMTPAEAADMAKAAATPDTTLPTAEVPRPPEPQQLDLFGEQPPQGSFRFMSEQTPPWNDITKPPTVANTPPGELYRSPATGQIQRSASRFETFGDEGSQYDLGFTKPPAEVNPNTGVFRGPGGKFGKSTEAYKQLGMDLPEVPHQSQLELLPPSVQRAVQEVAASTPEQASIRHGLADAVKATEGTRVPDPQTVLGAIGQVEPAGFLGAMKRILNPLGRGNMDVAKEVPTFANPTGFLQDSKVISRARAQSLAPVLAEQGSKLIGNFVDLARVSRLPPEALAVAKQQAEASLRKQYAGRLQSAILDVIHTPAEMHPSNVDTMSLKVGKPDMTLFDSEAQAKLYRDEIFKLGAEEAIPRQQGFGKYYLEIPKHVDETTDEVRNALVTPKNSTNTGIINMLLNRLRSAEDIVGQFQRENRQIAVHAPQELRKAIRDHITENIESLPKASRKAVEDILRANRDMPSVKYPGERGRWYDTAGELEQAFVARHGRLPTEKEILAYDSFKRLSDFDWLLRNTAVYRDKARQSIEAFQFTHDAGKSPWFEGKQLDKMPWSVGKADQDAGIWVRDGVSGKSKFYYKFNMTPDERKYVDDLIENKGHRVVQVFDPKKHPLQGIAKTATGEDLKDQVNYVITNTWDKAPLSWKQVDYRPGGHVIYPNKWYVAQPQIQMGRGGKATYLGDNNILNFETEAQARKFAQRIDTARQMYKSGWNAQLEKYVSDNLPYSRNEFEDLFRRSDSPLTIEHPVTYKQSGKNTISTDTHLKAAYDNGNLIDSTKNVHDLSNFMDKSYLADRDNVLSTVMENSSALKLGPAEQLDPYIALNRAMGQGLQNIWTTDYKIGAVESWFKEFQHVMEPSDKSLMAHPMYYLFKPQWKRVSDAAAADLSAGKAAQRAIVNFIGSKSEIGQALDAYKMKALNAVYNKFGQGKILDTALATTADPVQFLRGLAFHSKLGMFNPVQFFVQAQSMAHSIAVAGPTHGLPGFAAAPLIRALGHNPTQLAAVARVATKLGWTEDMFKEMYQTLQKTGLYQVAGEAALRDDAFDPHLFRSTLGKWLLDAGPMFFNEGERMTRMTAFATAFREWRTANKTLSIGNRELGAIMRRADDLSVNMTRASNAAWQSGIFSIPMQFYAYNARVMEQLLGGRLTGVEKLRMMATYSALYGIPIGAGASVGAVWPVYDSVKQEAMRRGVDLNDGFTKVLTEGLVNYATHLLTGHDYNIAQRYGPGNNQAIKDALSGDKGLMDVMFGASGTILGDFVSATHPLWYQAASVASDTGDYPLQSSDWMTFFRNISTVDVAAKAWAAASYGKWYTKSGTSVGNADGMDAAMVALGLTPLHISDTFLQMKAQKEQKQIQAIFEKDAIDNFRRGLQAGAIGDYKSMQAYMTRAHTAIKAGDFNYADQARIYQRMATQNQDLEDKVKWDAVRKAPLSQSNQFFNNYFKDKQ